MNIVLYPRVAQDNQSLLVWIGAFQHKPPAPNLQWFLNGEEVQPEAVRPIQSARQKAPRPEDDTLGADENVARAFTGLYKFTHLANGERLKPDAPSRPPYRVMVKTAGHEVTLETRTLPEKVPSDMNSSFNVLLVSCFHQAEDRSNNAGTLISQIKERYQPHVTLLLGDQVYLDLPTLMDFEENTAWLAKKFEDDYVTNWQGPEGYSRVMGGAPTASMPDDHEYWNNYPHKSYHIPTTKDEGGRAKWEKAARRMYEAFQLSLPAEEMGKAMTFDVHPLSFFLADMRTFRDYDLKRVLSRGDANNPNAPNALQQLRDWVQHVINNKLFGVFGSGQSLFAKPPQSFWGNIKQKVKGTVGDHELYEYEDFDDIVRELEKLSDAGRPYVCVTGDVHYGRVIAAKDLRKSWRISMYEVISSPTSLVTTLGVDWVKEQFKSGNPWPRHSDAPDPPEFYAQSALGQRFACEQKSIMHKQKGNHVTLLSFRDTGGGLEMRVRYWPLHGDRSHTTPVDLKDPIYLYSLG
jgi:hypothetical protein